MNSNLGNKKVLTFGCRLNIYESEIIKQTISQLPEEEDVTVFNTCAVTEEAERDAARQIRKIKKNNPKTKIIVTGCAAQLNEQKYALMPEVYRVLGNAEKLDLKNYQKDPLDIEIDTVCETKSKSRVGNIFDSIEIPVYLVDKFEDKTRVLVQIQNGCNHRCTFCIIPFARGNNRSVPIGVIVEQIKSLLNKGYQEIVFTGVDITDYGKDLPGQPTLSQMMRRVLNLVPNLTRLRLSSIDVAEIDEDLFQIMAYEPRIMPHFHISMQSGDNMILTRMKRRHRREQVIEFCLKLRQIRPEVAFGADIICGFPTEKEEMFENTKKIITEAGIQYLHVFPYSARANTPAARMPQVPLAIRKERSTILREIGMEQKQKFFTNYLNRQVEVLVEQGNTGHTANFIPVKFESDQIPSSLIKAELVSIVDGRMLAQPVINFTQ